MNTFLVESLYSLGNDNIPYTGIPSQISMWYVSGGTCSETQTFALKFGPLI